MTMPLVQGARSTPATGYRFDEASVTEADIEANNGVIHMLDQVISPEKHLY